MARVRTTLRPSLTRQTRCRFHHCLGTLVPLSSLSLTTEPHQYRLLFRGFPSRVFLSRLKAYLLSLSRYHSSKQIWGGP